MKFTSISEPFIRRPVATTLLTFGVALAGIVAFALLPVSPLPQVDIPTISVSASLPGASPETMATSVATPLERQLGRIAGVTEMTSSSSTGSTRVVLQFDLSRDIDGAAREVQAAISAARAQLPSGMPSNPTYRKVNPADQPIMVLAMTSDTLPIGKIYDAASTIVAQKISQVGGVGQANVGGGSLPAVRVDLNLNALNKLGVSMDTVRNALANANANRPKGSVELGDRHWQVYTNDQARTAQEYRGLIIAWKDGAAVRLSDVAEVSESVENVRNLGLANGERAVLIWVLKQPNANILDTVERVKALLPQLGASIPAGIEITTINERTTTIRASLHDVERTLVIAIVLVVFVVFVFLRSWRATLVPAIAVPVSLIGTFAAMYLAGFSLDNLSLMALTIATGFVVDDAVVVLENISRHIEDGMSRMQAVLTGAREVGFTVLSMSLSLIAVFVPILLMGGIVGRYFREFSVTLSVAILISLVVSLTTTPMMCAYLLRSRTPHRADARERPAGDARTKFLDFFRRWGTCSERAFAWLHAHYESSLGWALSRPLLMMWALLLTVLLNVYLYMVIPKGFFPQQDIGMLVGGFRADQSSSFQATSAKMKELTEMVKADPAVQSLAGFTGGSDSNGGFMFISLKPLAERKLSAMQVIGRLRPKLATIPGVSLFLAPAQDIRIGGRQSNSTYQYTLQSDSLQDLRKWGPKIADALKLAPELTDVDSDQQDRGLETLLQFDRTTMSRLGVTMSAVDSALNNAFGQRQVSTIYNALNQYHVVMEVAEQFVQNPDTLRDIYVASTRGKMVPLMSFATYGPGSAPLEVNHQGQFVSATVSFNLADGYSLSDATVAINREMARVGAPVSIHGAFAGTANAFQKSLDNQPFLILAALLAVYIVLGVLYESYVHPLTILSTLPSAGVGALLALLACGTEFSVIALIGVILLIGIVKKNAIMMIDFALEAERGEGLVAREAIIRACLLRFRPIMMTTLAAMLGALPLALGFGEGSEMRRPLGISIFGGLLVSQLLTLYTTPVVYLYLDRFRLWAKRAWARSYPVPPGAAPPAIP
ncbi:MAG: multidrug efflux RND transporter permease subunit [Proteobacteria bacterium]|uniref:multidrug efflux RND transporter permease subunit n=1 Tax=Rudaea sp. TaxID=2136325 RepID=UPI003783EA67|nr:multidrug efflux RND transporter permease subunit [Pseudomonadota bacterium]